MTGNNVTEQKEPVCWLVFTDCQHEYRRYEALRIKSQSDAAIGVSGFDYVCTQCRCIAAFEVWK